MQAWIIFFCLFLKSDGIATGLGVGFGFLFGLEGVTAYEKGKGFYFR